MSPVTFVKCLNFTNINLNLRILTFSAQNLKQIDQIKKTGKEILLPKTLRRKKHSKLKPPPKKKLFDPKLPKTRKKSATEITLKWKTNLFDFSKSINSVRRSDFNVPSSCCVKAFRTSRRQHAEKKHNSLLQIRFLNKIVYKLEDLKRQKIMKHVHFSRITPTLESSWLLKYLQHQYLRLLRAILKLFIPEFTRQQRRKDFLFQILQFGFFVTGKFGVDRTEEHDGVEMWRTIHDATKSETRR